LAKKVLIVDDTPGGFDPLREILTQPQLMVMEATSGRQALEVHRRERCDLIIMDVQMRGMDGEQVTKTIRSEAALRDVSILLFSDTARVGLRERCLASGANDYVAKPFRTADLMALVWPLVNVAVRKPTALLAHIDLEKDERVVESFVARVVNVSTSGLLVEADVLLTIGQGVRLKFFVPGSSIQISARAAVTRRTDVSGPNVRWGVRFLTLEPAMRQVLRDYVEGSPTSSEPLPRRDA
jgi:CheY-like chemotaxis protein